MNNVLDDLYDLKDKLRSNEAILSSLAASEIDDLGRNRIRTIVFDVSHSIENTIVDIEKIEDALKRSIL